jgi:molecular chaperone GrpE
MTTDENQENKPEAEGKKENTSHPKGGESHFLQGEIEKLKEQIKELQAERDAKNEQLLRALADLQNVKRRAQSQQQRLPQIGLENIIRELLPTLDMLEMAIQNKPKQEDDWTKGVSAIFSSFSSVLFGQGLEKIDQTGVLINPEIHEVLSIDENAKKGEVGEILQPGYKLKESILRVARVKGGREE